MIDKGTLKAKARARVTNNEPAVLSQDVLNQIAGGLLSGPKHADSHNDHHSDTVSNDW